MDNVIQETSIPMLKQSPRVDGNKVIKWYYGDTFQIDWYIALWRNNAPMIYDENDKIVIAFYHLGTHNMVHTFTVSGIGQDNKVRVEFTKEISRLFRPGKYCYTIKYFDGDSKSSKNITTLCAEKLVEVEKSVW